MKLILTNIPPARSVGFLFWVLLFSVGNIPLFAQSYQNIEGLVRDSSSGMPIENVNVICKNSGLGTSTNSDGYFSFERLETGDWELAFSVVGYRDTSITIGISSGFKEWIEVEMVPATYTLKPLIVTAQKAISQIQNGKIVMIYHTDSLRGPETSTLDLLKQVPGLIVSETGNGNVKVNLAGSESKRVSVYLDGINLTDPQTGEANLQAIPVGAVDEIEVVKGSTVSDKGTYGGGVVQLRSKPIVGNELQLVSSVRSYSADISKGKLQLHSIPNQNLDGLTQSLYGRIKLNETTGVAGSWSYNSANNDYEYQYKNEIFTRRHNRYILRNFYVSAYSSWKKVHLQKVLLSILQGNSNYQLPSYYYNTKPYTMATSKESGRDMLVSAIWSLSNRVLLTTDYQRKKKVNTADGSGERPFFRRFYTVNESESDYWVAKLSWTTGLPSTSVEMGYRQEKHSLNQKNRLTSSESSINNLNARIVYAIINFNPQNRYFNSNFSWNFSSTSYNGHNTKFLNGLLGRILKNTVKWQIGMWGEIQNAYQFPSLSDLFWTGSARATGNPNLKPELGHSLRAGLTGSFNWKGNHTMALTLFKQDIDNYIAWQPDFNGIWKPHNLYATTFSGMEFQYQVDWSQFFKVGFSYMTQNPLNKTKEEANYFNKKVPYIFISQFKGDISGKFKQFFWSTDFRHNSKRYTNFYNTPGTEASPFTIWNVQVGYKCTWSFGNVIAKFKILNLLNEMYDLIVGYPMPGRTYVYQIIINL